MYNNNQDSKFANTQEDKDSVRPHLDPANSGNYSGVSFPGTKSFHVYNTLLFIFTAIQLGLYAAQGANAQCSQLKGIFFGFMAVYIYTLMVPIITLIANWKQTCFTFAILYTILAILGKIGVIIASFAATSGHVGYCFVSTEVKVGITIANAAEIFSLCVQLLFIRYLSKVRQMKEMQMTMDAGRRKGYF